MKLKPHEILQKLGFDIGEEGIEIYEHDTYLNVRTLELIGKTLDPQQVPDDGLFALHASLAVSVPAWRGYKPSPTKRGIGA